MSALAEAVREACLRELLSAYEDAGMQGLCGEGRWEHAVAAVRRLDLAAAVEGAREAPAPPAPARGGDHR